MYFFAIVVVSSVRYEISVNASLLQIYLNIGFPTIYSCGRDSTVLSVSLKALKKTSQFD